MQCTESDQSLWKELSTTSHAATDRRQVVLGWDPAFRTGCKLAVVDATGKVLDTVVIYPTAPQNKVEEAKKCCQGTHQEIWNHTDLNWKWNSIQRI